MPATVSVCPLLLLLLLMIFSLWAFAYKEVHLSHVMALTTKSMLIKCKKSI